MNEKEAGVNDRGGLSPTQARSYTNNLVYPPAFFPNIVLPIILICLKAFSPFTSIFLLISKENAGILGWSLSETTYIRCIGSITANKVIMWVVILIDTVWNIVRHRNGTFFWHSEVSPDDQESLINQDFLIFVN